MSSSSDSFFEPADDRGGRDAEGAPESPQAGSLLVGAKDLLLALLGVAVGRRIFTALTPASVTEILLLAVIGRDTILDEIVASAVAAVDDFGNRALTLTCRPYHSRLAHYQEIINVSCFAMAFNTSCLSYQVHSELEEERWQILP